MNLEINKSEIFVREINTLINNYKTEEILSNEENLLKFQQLNNIKRQNEFLASRILILEKTNQLLSTQNKKPKIKTGYVSVSHKDELISVALNDQFPVGIDIEKINENIKKLKNKFCTDFELKNQPKFIKDEITYLTMLWTGKEAVYKTLENQKNIFLSNIEIVIKSNAKATGFIFENIFELDYITIAPNFLLCHSQQK